jgi:hypothetical protein
MSRDWRWVNAGRTPLHRAWAAFEHRIATATRPTLMRWEALPGQVQVGITYPVTAVLLFVFHVVVFDLSAARSAFYALFWAVMATAIVYVATHAEAAKRARNRPPNDE